ncbi:hypothetical protein BGW80DRAFT_622452 [Lactifluus volemus]|nr:hypothetical protein BGW80DRAFT_622452 [Lactifluus volemus]
MRGRKHLTWHEDVPWQIEDTKVAGDHDKRWPSLPRVTAQRMPFADQLAASINSTKTPTTFPTSEKSRPAAAPMSDVPSLLGKVERQSKNVKVKLLLWTGSHAIPKSLGLPTR